MNSFIRTAFVVFKVTRLAPVDRGKICVRRQGTPPVAAFVAALLLLSAASQPLHAQQQRISFIRDAETEHIIRVYAAPVFRAAGLNPADINVHLINDRTLNAFVAGGLNMFFHTGLLLRSDNPSQLSMNTCQ